MNNLKNRREIIFLYDVSNNNPNGDPDDDNKPRLDEESKKIRVTDVRLKRTIRDYLSEVMKLDVFVKEYRDTENKVKNKDQLIKDFKLESEEDMLNKFIDIRLFGTTTAVKKNTITLTGPVQFKMGISLHESGIELIKGTTVFSSGSGETKKGQGTMTDKWITPYALIAFYGLVNENAATHSNLKDEDIDNMLEAIWNGTKLLSSVSKIGHMPRLLIEVTYKEEGLFHIGDLEKEITYTSPKPDSQIRDIRDIQLDLSNLEKTLEEHRDKIEKIRIKKHDSVAININLKQTEEFDF